MALGSKSLFCFGSNQVNYFIKKFGQLGINNNIYTIMPTPTILFPAFNFINSISAGYDHTTIFSSGSNSVITFGYNGVIIIFN